MALAVFVMYVILAILYESYVHPVTVLSTLPTALVGGLLTLFVFGEQASLYAFVGLFMLMGIVKKNGIMIVDFARQRLGAGAWRRPLATATPTTARGPARRAPSIALQE
jgi:HAE1 family hydrophobic/amphiphilic exporter-1